MDMLGTVHKWKPNVTDMIWRCLGTAIAMPNTMETRAQEPWSDYSWFFTDRASKSNQQNILKKDQTKAGHERGQNEVRTRYQTRSKTTRDMTNPKCLNVIHQNTSLDFTYYFMLFYHIWTLPILTNIYVAKTKQRMADTHLSIETTYIAYPICYTMMLPNMPFRKADAHPLRLNTRCKDLTLVPSNIYIYA